MGQGLSKKMGCSWIKPKNFWTFSGGYEPIEREFNCPQRDLQLSVMTADGQLNALDVVTVGLIDAGYRDIDDRYLVTSLETAQMLMNSKSVNMISIKLKHISDRKKVIDKFYEMFPLHSSPLRIMNWVDHPIGETYVKTLELMSVFRNFVVIVILIISVLSVMNTLIKIIKERSREIGTLRSIGFKAREVLRMFVYETLMLSALGTFIGALISLVLTVTFNFLQIRYKAGMLSEPVLFKINVSIAAYLNAFLVLLFVSLLACLFSTRQEIKKKIVDNLTHV
jgi:putative ABC transport system permease protein